MQKKIIAATVAVLCGLAGSAFAQQNSGGSKVELWGIVDAAVRHTNNEGNGQQSKTQMIGGGMSQSRFGINVEEDLGNGSKALAVLENRFTTDDGNAMPTAGTFFQLAYVGLRTPYGQLTMGRQYNVLFDVVTSTYASFPYSPYMEAYKPELGLAVLARSNNALKYSLANSDRSLVATLQYSFKENADSSAVFKSIADSNPGLNTLQNLPLNTNLPGGATVRSTIDGLAGSLAQNPSAALQQQIGGLALGAMRNFGGFLRYSKNGLSLGTGYLRTDLPAGSKLDAWTLGGSYRTGKLYVNLGYGVNKVKYKVSLPTNGGQYARAVVDRIVDQGVMSTIWGVQTNGGFQAGDANKRQMFKVGFGYQITPQINAGMHYYHAKQSGSTSLASNGKANFLVGAIDYAFSKRTDAYFAVDHTKLKGGNAMFIDATSRARSRTGITFGLRHRF